jgi:hypothetical protein
VGLVFGDFTDDVSTEHVFAFFLLLLEMLDGFAGDG